MRLHVAGHLSVRQARLTAPTFATQKNEGRPIWTAFSFVSALQGCELQPPPPATAVRGCRTRPGTGNVHPRRTKASGSAWPGSSPHRTGAAPPERRPLRRRHAILAGEHPHMGEFQPLRPVDGHQAYPWNATLIIFSVIVSLARIAHARQEIAGDGVVDRAVREFFKRFAKMLPK